MNEKESFKYHAERKGVAVKGCGIGVRDLLKEMSTAPLPCGRTPDGRIKMPGNQSLGAAVKAGLARFVRDHQHYEITDAGRAWLAQLMRVNLYNIMPAS